MVGLGRGRGDKARPPASRSLEPHPALFLHCSASPNPGSEFATHEHGPFRPRPPSSPGFRNLVAGNPAAGVDRVRRRKGVASAAAPHPCPRLRFCERRRRGLVLWWALGQGSPPAAAVAKGSHGGPRSFSENSDLFYFHLCWHLATNSALIITEAPPGTAPLFHHFGSSQTLLPSPKITLPNQPNRPIVRPY